MFVMMAIVTFVFGTNLSHAKNDVKGHWSEETVTKWLGKQWVQGYPDRRFKPNESLTRAELMALINRAFGYTMEADVPFRDVSAPQWFYPHVRKAVAAGYATGYPDQTIRPKEAVSRQEAAAIFTRIKKRTSLPEGAGAFADANRIPAWSRGSIGAVLQAGYMKGFKDNTFRPTNKITRAEAITTLERMLGDVASGTKEYATSGQYGPTVGEQRIAGDVVVRASDVTLNQMRIQGTLTLDIPVGAKMGNVTLNQIIAEKGIVIRETQGNSLLVNGGTVSTIVIDNTLSKSVRIVGNVLTPLEVKVANQAVNQFITIEGTLGNVSVQGKETKLIVRKNTKITKITVENGAENPEVAVENTAKIDQLIATSPVKINNFGDVQLLTIEKTAQGSVIRNESFGTIGTIKASSKLEIANAGIIRTAIQGTSARDIVVTGNAPSTTSVVIQPPPTPLATATTLTVQPNSWTLPATGASTNVVITTSGAWTAVSSQPAWLTVSAGSGNGNANLAVTASTNTSNARTGQITVVSGNVVQTIVVNQVAGTALTTSLDSWNPVSVATSISFVVTTNVSWVATTNTPWLTISPSSGSGNGNVTLLVTENTGGQRTGQVTITAGALSKTIPVTQANATTLALNMNQWNLSAAANATTVFVSTNVEWLATSNQGWLTVSPANRTGNGTFVLNAAANLEGTRMGTITVVGGGRIQTLVVTQASPSALTVTPMTWTPLETATTQAVTVTANSTWTAVSSQPTWLTLSTASGTGNGNVTVSVTQNTGIARTGTVVFTSGGVTQTVTVTQAGATLVVTPTTWTPTFSAMTLTIPVTANSTWIAVSSQPTWLTLSTASGTGNGNVTVSVTQNTGIARTGTVVFTSGGVTQTVTVTQAGTS
jgi:hypothetical protein